MAQLKRHIFSPGKIILFGEWAVMHGHLGISSAVEARFVCHWSGSAIEEATTNNVAKSGANDAPTYIFRSSEGLALWDPLAPLKEQQHIPAFFTKTVAFFEALLRSPQRHSSFDLGGELKFEREWPIDWGLGSSSAVVACFLELMFAKLSLPEKWTLGRSILQKCSSAQASALDLAAQLKGGTVYLRDHKPMGTVLSFPEELCFLHAGDKADTTKWIQTKNPRPSQLKALGDSAEQFLQDKDWEKAIEEHANILAEMDLWPDELRKLRKEWRDLGKARAMKSCGSGGGDCWMLLVDTNNFEELAHEAQERGYTLVRHKISDLGVREIFSENTQNIQGGLS